MLDKFQNNILIYGFVWEMTFVKISKVIFIKIYSLFRYGKESLYGYIVVNRPEYGTRGGMCMTNSRSEASVSVAEW